MSDISDISSILQKTLLLTNINKADKADSLSILQSAINAMPSVLKENSLTDINMGLYNITLQKYTNLNMYNSAMNSIYGNKSADKFKNTLALLADSGEDNLANAKNFVEKMRQNGMSAGGAVKTYSALQKYSLLTSLESYNFVNSKV